MTTQMDGQNDATEGAELPRRVLKFGGTSVTGAGRLDVIEQVLRGRLESYNPVVVVSALSGVTEMLRTASQHAAHGDATELLEEIGNKHRVAVAEMTGGHPEAEAGVDEVLADVDRLMFWIYSGVHSLPV